MKPKTESQIQKDYVAWFRARYPEVEMMFFAVPNGGARNSWTAKIMRDEGVRAGVAALAIEMKTPEGRQTDSQKAFERACRRYLVRYVVCRSLYEFQTVVRNYLEE